MAGEFPGLCYIPKEAEGRAACLASKLGKVVLLPVANAGFQPVDVKSVPAQASNVCLQMPGC